MAKEIAQINLPERRKERGPRIRGAYEVERGREDYYAELGLSRTDKMLASLTEEELAFAAEMCLNGCDQVKAYSTVHKICGEMTKEQYRRMSEILHDQRVRRAIRAGIQRKMADALDNLDAKLLNTYITRAFYDPVEFIDNDGDPKPLSKISPEIRCVIDGIEKKYYGKDADAYTITYKLANRDTALKTLSEYMGQIRPTSKLALTEADDPAKNIEVQEEKLKDMTYEELEAELRKVEG